MLRPFRLNAAHVNALDAVHVNALNALDAVHVNALNAVEIL